MYVSNNVINACQIKGITNEALVNSKNYINSIANRILKYTPLLTAMIQASIVFTLANPVEGAALHEQTFTTVSPRCWDVPNNLGGIC